MALKPVSLIIRIIAIIAIIMLIAPALSTLGLCIAFGFVSFCLRKSAQALAHACSALYPEAEIVRAAATVRDDSGIVPSEVVEVFTKRRSPPADKDD